MSLALKKIPARLAKIRFSTAHAHLTKANIICHLASYMKSVETDGELDLSALFAAYRGLCWLIGHIAHIDDKQVLPSERLFLSQSLAIVLQVYEQNRSI